MRIGVLNAGTATIKAARFRVDAGEAARVASTTVELGIDESAERALRVAMERVGLEAGAVDAVGHRVVHGGARLVEPVLIDDAVEREIEACVELAPLHNPRALEGIRAARTAAPGLPMVAVFDTAFHASRSPESLHYALPWRLGTEQGVLRYGFHGIAHGALVQSIAEARGVALAEVDAVTLQLGAGCSACAVHAGRSIETSMGFTPLEGLAMATRSGDVDPGVVFHLIRRGLAPREVERMLTRESGLLGLAGDADLRRVLRAEAAGDPRAATAVGIFVRRIVATVGAYLTLLDGRGAIAFGGGIGRNSAEIRRRVSAGLGAWGVELDPERNERNQPGRISSESSSRGIYAFDAEEEPWIARACARLLGSEPTDSAR